MTEVIAFHYTLTDDKGQTIDSSAGLEPLAFMAGAGQIIPGLEKFLAGLKLNEKNKITIPAAEAYGPRQMENIHQVPREKFPKKDIAVGDQFEAGGAGAPGFPMTVTAVSETHVTLDANHPLAGVDLTFDVEVVERRAATEEEMAHGHVHGAGGHHH